ncbi:MAG: ATP-binding protein [Ignavibacteria bacterium]|nr:ATP-binding protein [Ignavibacteria bacterium]
MHNLLKRQLKRFFNSTGPFSKELEDFITAVDNAYHGFDTDREMLERSLELSSSELITANTDMRGIFQSIPDLFFRINSSGVILDYKAGSINDFIIQPRELIGKRIQDIPDKDASAQFASSLQLVHSTGTLVSFEYKLQVQNKNYYYEARLLPIPEEQYIAMIRNITARKEVQEELEKTRALLVSAIEQSPAGMLIVDAPDSRIRLANQAALRMRSGSSMQVIPAARIDEYNTDWIIYYPDGKTPYREEDSPLTLAIKEGIVSKNIEAIFKTDTGEERWLTFNAGPVRDKEGKIVAGIVVVSDITDKKIAEAELIQAKERAEEMNRVKSSFLANMSHELRTPLIGILGYAEILQSELADPMHLKMADTIFNSGKRLSRTLNMILDLSKIEANKLEVSLGRVGVVRCVHDAALLFSAPALQKGLAFDISCPNEEIYANLDEHLLVEILHNLLNNALKYTRAGSVVVIVENEFDNARHWVSIRVQDTGIGIHKNDLPLIFEEFRQVSEGFGRSYEGSGLGLTITKRITELMYGHLVVHSEVGKGSTFMVRFPALE